jgi:hypothetical protein
MESRTRGIKADQHGRMEDVHSPVFEGSGFEKDDDWLVVGQHLLDLEQV